jgi:transcriptional regulator with XRE-family HTH domain
MTLRCVRRVKAVLKPERTAKQPRNIVGPEIRRLRKERGLSQPMLVAKLNLAGWQISRETLAKIETQLRWVADFELVCLASVFKLSTEEILPNDARRKLRTMFAR